MAGLVYDRLHAMARRQLYRPLPGATLTPTVLVHEAYLKLVNQRQADWKDREHFLAVAATAMRHIVVDYARRKKSQKRGAGAPLTLVDGSKLGVASNAVDILALDEALEKLSKLDPCLARSPGRSLIRAKTAGMSIVLRGIDVEKARPDVGHTGGGEGIRDLVQRLEATLRSLDCGCPVDLHS